MQRSYSEIGRKLGGKGIGLPESAGDGAAIQDRLRGKVAPQVPGVVDDLDGSTQGLPRVQSQLRPGLSRGTEGEALLGRWLGPQLQQIGHRGTVSVPKSAFMVRPKGNNSEVISQASRRNVHGLHE